MEYLDIYDENGNKLGIKKPRKEAHDKGLWHKAVHIWIANSNGELLIQKRSSLKDNYPDMWDISTGGHISAGDDDVITAQREIKEELGLKIKPEDLTYIGIEKRMTKRIGYINNEIVAIYIVKKDLKLSEIKKQGEEVSEVKFIPYKELQKFIENKDPSFVPHFGEYRILFKFLEN